MATTATPPLYNLKNPFFARLTENRLLTRDGSDKETRHLVVDLEGSGLRYNCGDSLGIFCTHRDQDVEDLLAALHLTGEEIVQVPREEPMPLRQALHTKLYFLAEPGPKFLQEMTELATDPGEKARLEDLLKPENALSTAGYLHPRHAVDLLEEFPSVRFEAQAFVGLMKRLNPRLYSIASAPSVCPEEVHLTIAAVRYETLGRERVGVGSTYSIDRVPLGEPVLPVFIAKSPFGLPASDETDMIMVGPGTGVAPFRSFLMERESRGATGRNWLFFGEQHRATDYLYEEDFERWHQAGLLTHLDLAWSRDQAEKVYVQHLLRQRADEVWSWLQGGASFYICGDAKRMAVDVEEFLLELISERDGVTREEAVATLKVWRKEKRYQKDVY